MTTVPDHRVAPEPQGRTPGGVPVHITAVDRNDGKNG